MGAWQVGVPRPSTPASCYAWPEGTWQELGRWGPGKEKTFSGFSSDLPTLILGPVWSSALGMPGGGGTALPWQGEQLLGQALKSKNIPMSLAPSLPGVLPWASLQQSRLARLVTFKPGWAPPQRLLLFLIRLTPVLRAASFNLRISDSFEHPLLPSQLPV